MKNNYNVNVTAFASVLVIGAESEEQATEYALNRLGLGDMHMDEASVRIVKTDEELAACRRHADAISEED